MPIVEDSIRIAAPRDELFALAQDYDLRLAWDPFLRSLRFLDGATAAAPGVRVQVRARNGLGMEVEYLTVVPPSHVAMQMVRGPRFLDRFAGTWRFEACGERETEVVFRYGFRTRWRILRPFQDPIVRLVFRRDVRARLRGLKRAAETTDLLAHV